MRLTSLSLICLCGGFAAAAVVVTLRFWRTARPWRPAVRVAGLVLIEALVVLTAGLVANRAENFYPSWQVLTGDLAPLAHAVRPAPGRLDQRLAASSAGLVWTPTGYPTWHLAAPPTVIAPAGYQKRADRTFPVIVVLATTEQVAAVRDAAAGVPDALTVIVTPGPDTTAAHLAALPGRLAHDARVSTAGWALVADRRYATLAAQWHKSSPGRVGAATVIDVRDPALAVDAAARQLPAALVAPMRLPS